MPTADTPRLRPYLRGARYSHDPHHVYLSDRLGLAPAEPRLSPSEFAWLDFFDGRHSLGDVRDEAARRGNSVTVEALARLAGRLDDNLCLDTPRFRAVAEAPVRPPRCIGCYEGDPQALRAQVEDLFTRPGGPGLPHPPRPDGRLRAALVPHMDYRRGGVCYGWGFKEVYERTDAALFVIIGTSHHSPRRVTLTRKSFQTPLGIVPTDQDFADHLVASYGEGLFEDEWLGHFPEHSIELEVVILQYLYPQRRNLRIVPLVVGSLHDCVTTGANPLDRPDVRRLVKALRAAEAATRESVCFLISGDLAHIGPKFNDGQRLDDALLRHSHARDQELLRHAEAADAAAYFRAIAAERDARNVCGLPPTFATLAALRPSSGKVLHYGRYIHPHGFESVSFASMTFDR